MSDLRHISKMGWVILSLLWEQIESQTAKQTLEGKTISRKKDVRAIKHNRIEFPNNIISISEYF